jgi:hypothetical protein
VTREQVFRLAVTVMLSGCLVALLWVVRLAVT